MPRISLDDKSLERGERVIKARKALDLTQTDFGKLAGGYAQGTVYNWEAKGQTIPNNALASLHRAGVDVLWLLTGEGEMEAKPKGEEP